MTSFKRRLLMIAASVILIALVLAVVFNRSTREALECAEALQFRRMPVTKLTEMGPYRFFYITNRNAEQPDGPLEERFRNERDAGLRFGLFDTDIEPSLGIGMLVNPTDWFQNEEIPAMATAAIAEAGSLYPVPRYLSKAEVANIIAGIAAG